jgi:hypothetical protein
MTSTDLAPHAESFRSAVKAHEFALAQTALQKYVSCFQSCCRTLQEIEEARNLLQWGVEATKAQKAQLAEELVLLRRVFDAYRPPKRFHTWHVEG